MSAARIAPQLSPARNTSDLLETCRQWIRRYVVVSSEQAVILAAWVLHTYVFESAEVTPYIHITAPERECGKSNLMRVLAAVAANPILSEGMTVAALVRCVDAKKPSLLLDEMDATLGGDKEYAEAIRGVLNAGFHKGGKFYKCVGREHALVEFDAYCPKCFAGIGRLPETVASRSIVIEMRRKRESEWVQALREREINEAAQPVKEALACWGDSVTMEHLSRIRPAAVPELGSRQNDIAEPLLCIATLAGTDWLQRLTMALQTVFRATSNTKNVSTGVALLDDIRTVFDELRADRIPSKILTQRLNAMEGRPWGDWNHGNGLTPNNLARQLEKYRIGPRSVRIGNETAKGYPRADFEDTWDRYCPQIPPEPSQSVTPSQSASSLEKADSENRHTPPDYAPQTVTSGVTGEAHSVSRRDARDAGSQREQRSVTDVTAVTASGERGDEDCSPWFLDDKSKSRKETATGGFAEYIEV